MMTIRLILLLMMAGLFGCSAGPKPIDYGKEECAFCKMTIMDKQFGCQVVNTKGKHFNFDDLSCLVGYLLTDIISADDIGAIYVPDYTGSHELIQGDRMHFVESEMLHSPMAGNIAAFSNKDSAQHYAASLKGKLVILENIMKKNE
jgi:copper chaperone NosL